MNRYAIGDIHGGLQTFLALIRRIAPRRDDRIYLLGDYIDRGPDSRGVLDAIIRMQEAGCDLRPILGNHDDMLLKNITGIHDEFSWYWMEGWGKNTLKSFGLERVGEVPERYLNLLESMPLCHREGEFFLVHAGLDMTKDDPLTESAAVRMLWGEAAYMGDSGKLGKAVLVTGHKIRNMHQIAATLSSSHIHLDNGAFGGREPEYGNLVALNLDTMQLITQPWLDGESFI